MSRGNSTGLHWTNFKEYSHRAKVEISFDVCRFFFDLLRLFFLLSHSLGVNGPLNSTKTVNVDDECQGGSRYCVVYFYSTNNERFVNKVKLS